MCLYYSTAFIHKCISLIRVESSTDNTFPTAMTYSPHVIRPPYFHQRRTLNTVFLVMSERNIYVVDKCEFSWNLTARYFIGMTLLCTFREHIMGYHTNEWKK